MSSETSSTSSHLIGKEHSTRSFSPTLEDVQTLDTTIVLLLRLGLCSVCLALGGMRGVALLLAFNRTVGSLLATRTALECGSILGLLCTAVTACITGLLLASHSEARTDTRVSRSVGLLAGLGTIQSEQVISNLVILQSYIDVLLPLLAAYAALQLATIITLSRTAVAAYINR